jgi:hypothetical protein
MKFKWLSVLLLIFFCGAASRGFAGGNNEECPSREEYEVFAVMFGPAAVSDETTQIVLEDTTALRDLFGVSDRQMLIKELKPLKMETIEDFFLMNKAQCKLSDRFNFKVKVNLVSNEELDQFFKGDLEEGWKAFHRRYPKAGSFDVLSRVGFSKDHTQALIYYAYFCGSLCGEGRYFVLEKIEGQWTVKSKWLTWIS